MNDINRSLLEMNNSLLTMVLYMLVSDRMEIKKREDVYGDEDPHCAYCDFETSAVTSANIRRSLSAHVRQLHPDKWREMHECNKNRADTEMPALPSNRQPLTEDSKTKRILP